MAELTQCANERGYSTVSEWVTAMHDAIERHFEDALGVEDSCCEGMGSFYASLNNIDRQLYRTVQG